MQQYQLSEFFMATDMSRGTQSVLYKLKLIKNSKCVSERRKERKEKEYCNQKTYW
jgi:hypothetical protein